MTRFTEVRNCLNHHSRRRMLVYLFLLVVVGGVLLRVPGLDRDLWADETWSLFSARGADVWLKIIPNGPEITSNTFTHDGGWRGTLSAVGHSESTPPLFYLLLRLWIKLFGESNTALRLLSVFIGVTTIMALFFLGRKVFDEKTGLATAAVLAILPLHVQYSQEPRAYSLAVLLTTLASWAYWRAYQSVNQRQEWKYWLFYIGLSVTSLYAHYFTAGALIAHGLFALLQPKELRLPLVRRLTATATMILLLLAPWFLSPYFNDQLETAGLLSRKVKFWDPETPKRIAALICQLVPGYLPGMTFKSPLGLAVLGLYVAGIILPILAARRFPEWRSGVLFGLLLLAMPILFFLGVSRELQLVFLFPRYILPAVTGLALLLGVAISSSPKRLLSALTGTILLGVFLHFQVQWHRVNNSPNPLPSFQWFYGNVSSAVAEVNRAARSGELVPFEGEHLQLIWNVYDKSHVPQLVMGRGGFLFQHRMRDFESKWREVQRRYTGIYYVGRAGESGGEVVKHLERDYRLLNSKRVGRLEIRHYVRPLSNNPLLAQGKRRKTL